MRRTAWMVTAALFSLSACGATTSPNTGGGGGGGGGGPVGNVTVGNIFFQSAHNGTRNPAVDTITAGNSVTWTWNAQGQHSIQSIGTPGIFRNSVVMTAARSSYSVAFQDPGTYAYQCGVHGAAMSGRVVVLP